MEEGSCPAKSLKNKSKSCNLVSFPIPSGMVPIKLFLDSCSCSKLMRFSMPEGILPVMLLVYSISDWRLVERLPTDSGNTPLTLFLFRASTWSLLQFVNESMNLQLSGSFISNSLEPRFKLIYFQLSCSFPSSEGTSRSINQ